MDAVKRSIIGYRISSERDVGACILAMRMAFNKLKKLPEPKLIHTPPYTAISVIRIASFKTEIRSFSSALAF